MTTIVALKEKDAVYIASDQQVSIGDLSMISDQKIFKKNDMLVGVSGHSRYAKLIRYGFEPPTKEKKTDDMTYLNTSFVDSLIEFLDKKQYNKKFDSRVENCNTLLICLNGEIYRVSCDYDVSKFSQCNYLSIGSGQEYANGSMYSTMIMNKSLEKSELEYQITPETRLEIAVKAACNFDTGSGGDVKILKMGIK